VSKDVTPAQALGLAFDPDEAYPGAEGPTTSGGLGLNGQVPADLPAEEVDDYLEEQAS
jgi:hypothetical protein